MFRRLYQVMYLLWLSFPFAICSAAETFEFVVLGDTAYKEDAYPAYAALIGKINDSGADFTIHVGDTLGYQSCEDDTYDRIDAQFEGFEMPLIYTPGDNEWTDCMPTGLSADVREQRPAIVDYKLGRLDELRRRYFSDDESLGQRKLKLRRQSAHGDERYRDYAENSYWIHNEVLFATVHIVGSSDNFHPYIEGLTLESIERRGANYSWITQMIEVAREHKVKAIVLAAHGAMFEREETDRYGSPFSGTAIIGGRSGPFVGYVYAMSVLADNFDGPVLYVHGDYHRFVVDRPLMSKQKQGERIETRYDNFTRLQVFGHPELRAVKVTVDTDTEHVFGFVPM